MGVYGNGKDKNKRASKSGSVVEAYDASFVGYINVDLSEAQKATFEQWAASASPMEQLEAFTADGIHFSLKIDPRSSGFLASATQRRASSPNAGLVVTARAKEAWKALFRLVFVLSYLSRTERWQDTQPVANPDRW